MESFTSMPCVLMLRVRHSEFEFSLSLFFSDWTINTRGVPCGDRSQLCIPGDAVTLITSWARLLFTKLTPSSGPWCDLPHYKRSIPPEHDTFCPARICCFIRSQKEVKVVLSRSTLKDYSVEKIQELIAPHSVHIGTPKAGVTAKCSIRRGDNR